MTSRCVVKLKENKTVSGCSQTQQYIFVLFYLDNMFQSTDHQAFLTKLKIRCMECKQLGFHLTYKMY